MRTSEVLPKESLLRLYDPTTQGTSFSLDGFPALKEGKDWQARLTEFIERKGALGMTTNQTLFRQLLETGALDERLRELKGRGATAAESYSVLYNEAATEAAHLFERVHSQWPCEGRVSQEASALLTDLDPLVRDVQRIAEAMAGVGAFTKIPNLRFGPEAIRKAVAAGRVHPNVTLVFSDKHYLDTVEGYLLGLKDLAGRPASQVSSIHSVNSLFVSRVDRVVDPMVEGAGPLRGSKVPGPLQLLRGNVAVAQAKIVYRLFEGVFLGRPFADPEGLYADEEGKAMLAQVDRLRSLYASLKPLGANPQRLLIASSGVKSDQPYHSLLYVLPFLGPWCANTLPEGTLEALSRFVAGRTEAELSSLRWRNLMAEPLPAVPTDSKPVEVWERALLMTSEERRRSGIAERTPDQILRQAHEMVFEPLGTSLRKICDGLRDKGAQAFTADEQATLQAIDAKLQAL